MDRCIGKLFFVSVMYLKRSVVYVRGDSRETIWAIRGRWFMGMKIPLIKMRGNFMRDESIIMFAGVSAGGAESSKPKKEKHRADATTLKRRRGVFAGKTPMTRPDAATTKVIVVPNNMEAIASPERMMAMLTGDVISLSKVLALVSHGAITGPTAVEVKKTVIDIMLASASPAAMFLPTA